jgi:hypothetical protein
MSVSTGDLVSRVYGNFRGVDFRGEEINLRRSPDSLNVWKDYRYTESIRTRPGMKFQVGNSETVYGIYFYKGNMLLHQGSELLAIDHEGLGSSRSIAQNMNAAPSNGFVYEDVFYIMDGKNYLQYNNTGNAKEVVGYIPTTTIGRRPSGGGTPHEDVNMLSPYRINSFLADGKSTEFYLDTKNIESSLDPGGMPVVTVNDVEMPYYSNGKDNWYVDNKAGKITFVTAPPAPKTDGQDNVKIKFKKTVSGYADNIKKCTLLQVFDNRVFVSGNPNYPNYVWHCSLDDPTYFSDLDYYREGMDEAKIKGLVAGNNALWVFREPSEANTNVFYHTPTIDADYGKIYPSTHSSITIGCVGKAINFNDDIIFFSERGMEGISGDVTTEQAAAHRSSLVDRKLIAESGYKNMILEEWEGYLLVIIGNKVYLADSRTAFTTENHIEYDWFYWEMEKEITCARVYEGVLYLGTADGVYTLTDTEAGIESYWVTPKDKFKVAHKLKTTNKRGCVVEATGDISVYAKVEDTDFELIGTYEKVTDYFVSRIKRKKWKDIQLKFYSETRFSLETATLEAFVGGYIKR